MVRFGAMGSTHQSDKEREMRYLEREKQVHVRAYTRLRFGRHEFVRSHWRSWPKQLSFW